MNHSRSHSFGGARNIARSRGVHGVSELPSAFCRVDSGVSGGIYHQLGPVCLDCCLDLGHVNNVAVPVAQADNLKIRRRCPEKLDTELSRCSRDEGAHYSLRIWVR
jgi:hypothetical protein